MSSCMIRRFKKVRAKHRGQTTFFISDNFKTHIPLILSSKYNNTHPFETHICYQNNYP